MVVLLQHYQNEALPARHPCRLFPYNYPVVMLYATGYTVKFMDCSCRFSSTITHVIYPQNEIRYILIEGSQTCRLPSRYTILKVSLLQIRRLLASQACSRRIVKLSTNCYVKVGLVLRFNTGDVVSVAPE